MKMCLDTSYVLSEESFPKGTHHRQLSKGTFCEVVSRFSSKQSAVMPTHHTADGSNNAFYRAESTLGLREMSVSELISEREPCISTGGRGLL